MKDITEIRNNNIEKCISNFNSTYQKILIVMVFLFVLTDKNVTADDKNEIGIPFVGLKAAGFTVGTISILLYTIFGVILLRTYQLLRKNLADIPLNFPEQYKVMQDNPSWFLLKGKMRGVILLLLIIFFYVIALQSYMPEPSVKEKLFALLFSIPHIILLFIFLLEDAKTKK